MKRCPQCNRVETDDALTFCRTDGTPLVRESGLVNADSGTFKFDSAPIVNEIETSAEAQKLLNEIKKESVRTYVQSHTFALIYIGLGEGIAGKVEGGDGAAPRSFAR